MKINSKNYKIGCVNILCSELNKEVDNVEIVPGVNRPKCNVCGNQLFIIFNKRRYGNAT